MTRALHAKRRQTGQAAILDSLLAIGIASVIALGLYRQEATVQRLEKNQIAAHQMQYFAKQEARYINKNYTAFEDYFDVNATSFYGVSTTTGFEANVVCTTATNCLMPFDGNPVIAGSTAGWQSLATVGYEPSTQNPENIYHQTYVIVVACTRYGPTMVSQNACTHLGAILTTNGSPTVTDTDNGEMANDIGDSTSFMPIDQSITSRFTDTPTLTQNQDWSVNGIAYSQPGHLEINLGGAIETPVLNGGVQRYSGGNDPRTQTMGRTLYMTSDSTTDGPANVCFCPASGYYQGGCALPNTASIPNTPASPNYCQTPRN